MVFICLKFFLACSQAKCHRQHYHSPSCSGCEVDKRDTHQRGWNGGSFKKKPFQSGGMAPDRAEHRGGCLLSLHLYPGEMSSGHFSWGHFGWGSSVPCARVSLHW